MRILLNTQKDELPNYIKINSPIKFEIEIEIDNEPSTINSAVTIKCYKKPSCLEKVGVLFDWIRVRKEGDKLIKKKLETSFPVYQCSPMDLGEYIEIRINPVTFVLEQECIVTYGPILASDETKREILSCIEKGGQTFKSSGKMLPSKITFRSLSICKEEISFSKDGSNPCHIIPMSEVKKVDTSLSDRKAMKMKSVSINLRTKFDSVLERNVALLLIMYWMEQGPALQKYMMLFSDAANNRESMQIMAEDSSNVLKDENQGLKVQIESLERELEFLNQQKGSWVGGEDLSAKKAEIFESQAKNLMIKLKEMKESQKLKVDELNTLTEEKEILKNELEELAKITEEREETENNLISKLDEYKIEIDKRSTAIELLESEKTQNWEAVHKMKEDFESISESYTQLIDEKLLDIEDKIENKFPQLIEIIEDQCTRTHNIFTERAEIEDQINVESQKAAGLEAKYHILVEVNGKGEKEREGMVAEIQRMIEIVEDRDKELSTLKLSKEESDKKVDTLEQTLSQTEAVLNEKIKGLTDSLSEIKEEFSKEKTKCSDLKIDLEKEKINSQTLETNFMERSKLFQVELEKVRLVSDLLDVREGELDNARAELEEFDEITKKLKEKLQDKNDQIQELKQEITNFREKTQSADQESKYKLEELSRNIEILNEDLHQKEQALKKTKFMSTETQMELQNEQVLVMKQERQIEDQNEDLVKLRTTLDSLTSEKDSLNDQSQKITDELNQTISDLTQKSYETEKRLTIELSDMNETTQKEISELQSSIKQKLVVIESQKNTIEEISENLEKERENTGELESGQQESTDQLVELNKQIEKFQIIGRESTSEIEDLKNKVEILEKEVNDLNTVNNDFEINNQDLEAELSNYEIKQKEINLKLQQSHSKIQDLEQMISTIKLQNKKMVDDLNNNLKDKVDKIKKDKSLQLETLKSEYLEDQKLSESKILDLNTQLKEKSNEMQKLKEEIDNLDKKSAATLSEYSNKEQSLQDKINQIKSCHSDEIQSQKDTIIELQEKYNSLQSEYGSIQLTMKKLESEGQLKIQELQNIISNNERELSDVQSSLEKQKYEKVELENQIKENHSIKKDELDSMKTQFESEIEQMSNTLSSFEEDKSEIEKELQNKSNLLSDKIYDLEMTIQEKDTRLVRQDNQIDILQAETKSMTSRIIQLNQDIEEKDAIVLNLTSKNKTISNELSHSIQDKEELANQTHQKLSNKDIEIKSLNQKIIDLKKSLEQSLEDINNDKDQQRKEQIKVIQGLKEELSNHQESVKIKIQEINKLQNQVDSVKNMNKEANSQLKLANDELKDIESELKNEKNNHNKLTESSNRVITELNAKFKELDLELKQALKNHSIDLEDQRSSYLQEANSKIKSIESLHLKEISKIEKTQKELVDSLTEKYNDKKDHYKVIEKDLASTKMELQEEKNKNEGLRLSIDKISDEKKGDVQKLTEENHSYQNEISEYKQDLNKLNNQQNDLIKKNKDIEKQFKDIEEYYLAEQQSSKTLKQEFNQFKATSQKKISDLDKKLEDSNTKVNELSTHNDKYKAEVKSLKDQIKQIQDKLEEEKSQFDEKIKVFKQQIKDSNIEKDTLNQNLSELQSELEKERQSKQILEEKIDTLANANKSSASELQKELGLKSDEIVSLKESLNEHLQTLSNYEFKNQEIVKKLHLMINNENTLTSEMDQLKSEIKDTSQLLSERETSIDELKAQLSEPTVPMNEFKDIESKTELLKKEFESFKESSETEKLDLVKKFTGDLSREMTRNRELEEEIENLEADFEDLQTEKDELVAKLSKIN